MISRHIMQKLPKFSAHLIHPFLFICIPIVFLFSRNVGELDVYLLIRPLFVAIFILCISLLFLRLLIKDFSKITLTVSVSIVMFFSYSLIKEYIQYVFEFDPHIYAAILTAMFISIICMFCYYKIFSMSVCSSVHKFLNIMAATTLSISLVSVVSAYVETPITVPAFLPDPVSPITVPQAVGNKRFPDIIYIILDRYPNKHVMEKYIKYDNSLFIEEMVERGFFVENKAYANYVHTSLSLAATLNMRYLNELSEIYGRKTENEKPLNDMMQDHSVQRVLRLQGYQYVHMGSWWAPTRFNVFADLNFDGGRRWITRFESVLLQATPLEDAWKLPARLRGLPRYEEECDRVRRKIEFLKNVGGRQQPTFVFAHFLVPHDPIKFDAGGRCIDGASPNKREEREAFRQGFVGQVEFINKAIIEIFDRQMQNNPNETIFIIQADEGPRPLRPRLEGSDEFNWETATSDEIIMKFGILNLLFLPKRDYENFSQFMTPVNTFRIIFNEIFGAELPLLENRAYINKNKKNVYDFTDITEILQKMVEQ